MSDRRVLVAQDDAPTRAELERCVVSLVRDRLPGSWGVTEEFSVQRGRSEVGFIMEIEAPDGDRVRLLIECVQTVERRDVARITDRLRGRTTGAAGVPVVAARYLSVSVREALVESGLSYVDATGNVRISADSPAVFISDHGEDRDPWRKGRPRGTLKGEPAARVARAMLDYRRSWRVRELIEASGASTGATYRVLDYLQREDLVTKSEGRYSVTDWERLLRQWSADAPFQTTSRVMAFLDPRGVDNFLGTLTEDQEVPAAVTGSTAMKEWASYAQAKAAYVYVSSIPEAAERWRLRENTVAPNILLLEPATVGDVPFRNTIRGKTGYLVAAPAQVAADLLNGPGREPAEGEFLIEWMKANEEQWRRD